MEKVSIKALIEKKESSLIDRNVEDKWVDEILYGNSRNALFITTFNMASMAGKEKDEKRRDLFKRYHITGVFGLSNPMKSAVNDFMLLVLSTEPANTVLIGNCIRKLYRTGGVGAAEDSQLIFPNQYIEYYANIENWLNHGKDAAEGEEYWFHEISYNDFDYDHVSPLPYSKRCYEVRKFLQTEKTKPLSEIAKIIRPHLIRSERGKVIGVRDFQYPLNLEYMREGWKTDTILKIGDIVFKNAMPERCYLLLEQPAEAIYAGGNDFIVRTNDLNLSAYIIQYFMSDVGKTIIEASGSGAALPRMTLSNFRKTPIIEPKKPLSHYLELYRMLATKPKDISTYNHRFAAVAEYKEAESIEDVLNLELLENAKLYKGEIVREFLKQDFTELNSCYKAEAYKATLIMCGSILEAVLIDWASEYDQKDYFSEELWVTDKRTGRMKRAELIDYIDRINEINRPKWMTEAGYAHQIRKKRNLVHAKLCMNSEEINDVVCAEVIGYLKDVLATRGL